MTSTPFHYEVTVANSAIDANGHVNNVEYVRWMQEAAVAHADAGRMHRSDSRGRATWVVRSHKVEYRKPAFAGDVVQVVTWVENVRRAFSLRKYRFERPVDGALLAEGETDWVFVDLASGRPKSVPREIAAVFGLAGPDGDRG